jgi:hypothetical protein
MPQTALLSVAKDAELCKFMETKSASCLKTEKSKVARRSSNGPAARS